MHDLLEPLLAIPGAKIDELRDATLREHYEAYADNFVLTQFPYFYNENSYISRHLSRDAIRVFVRQIRRGARVPGIHSFGLWALKGAIADVGRRETAFYPRRSRMWLLIRNSFPKQHEQTEVVTYTRQFVAAVQPFLDPWQYCLFPTVPLPNYGHKYWGRNFSRLRRIKTHVDPENVFSHTQGILPLEQ